MGAKKKNSASKNNPDARVNVAKTRIVTSSDCEKCDPKCKSGIKYIESIIPGRVYHGVHCRRVPRVPRVQQGNKQN